MTAIALFGIAAAIALALDDRRPFSPSPKAVVRGVFGLAAVAARRRRRPWRGY
jgi:MYXO-CTERM domain-containing protein